MCYARFVAACVCQDGGVSGPALMLGWRGSDRMLRISGLAQCGWLSEQWRGSFFVSIQELRVDKEQWHCRRTYRDGGPLNIGSPLFFFVNHLPTKSFTKTQTRITDLIKLVTSMQTRAMKRKVLADGAPTADSAATGTSPDTALMIKLKLQDRSRPSWDSVCVDSNCPIRHTHNFGLRPQHGAHTAFSTDHGYPDTQPPPLIKVIIDTLRMDRDITTIYESFTDLLQDFYRAHGGRSDKYHGPGGMFGLGVYVTQNVHGDGVCVTHKHPECDIMVTWFEFESPGFGIRPIYSHPEGEGN